VRDAEQHARRAFTELQGTSGKNDRFPFATSRGSPLAALQAVADIRLGSKTVEDRENMEMNFPRPSKAPNRCAYYRIHPGVWIQDEAFAARRLSMMRITRRAKAVTVATYVQIPREAAIATTVNQVIN
jgi:hypothetical protein